MSLSLEILKPDRWRGKVVSVSCSPFVIGRDPDCHLRTTSRTVSQRQFAVHVREGRAFVQDLNTTNGTFVNGRQIKGEIEILAGDEIKVAPLVFRVRVEKDADDTVHSRPTPPPQTRRPKSPADSIEDEAAAALLQALSSEETGESESADEPHAAPASQTTMHEVKTSLFKPGATPPPPPTAEPFGTTSSAREILKRLKKKK